MLIEKWKDIKGFEKKYQISNTGKVKSLDYCNTGKEKIMSPRLNKRGIYTINLYKNNKAYNFSVALLVGRHFLTPTNENDVIIHIGDKINDCVTNLKYVSQSEARYYQRHKENKQDIIDEIYTNGQIREYKKIAENNEIPVHEMYKRLYRGWAINEAINIPLERKEKILRKRLYEYNGKLYSVKQLCDISNGIHEKALYKRLHRGWTVDEAINIPLFKYNNKKKVEVN